MPNSTEKVDFYTPKNNRSKEETAAMIAECQASGGHKTFWVSAEGSAIRDVKPEHFELVVERRVEERIAEADLSRAQRRMRARKEARPDLIQPVETVEDDKSEHWFLTPFSDKDVSSIGILMAARGFTIEDLTSAEAQHAFNVAMLCVGLVVSETDRAKHFEEFAEAEEFYDDPRSAGTSKALREQLVAMNPFLFDGKKKVVAKLLPSRWMVPQL